MLGWLVSCGSVRGSAATENVVPSAAGPQRIADRVILGGDVRTMNDASPHAEAIAIAGGNIVAVGTDAEMRAWIGANTEVMQLAGETVTPGLVDAHAHLMGLGADLETISLREATSSTDAAARVAASEQAKTTPGDGWLFGRGWDQNRWSDREFPHRRALDQALPGRAIMLRRVDGHAAWVSSEALRRAGITKATRDPSGGKIVRDRRGEPTGVLIDNAMELVDRVIPSPTRDDMRRHIARGARAAIEAGLTGVHEMGIGPGAAAIYNELASAGELPLRVSAYVAAEVRPKGPPTYRGERFEMRGVKLFVDGALGSRGARLKADYSDDPGNRGLWVMTPDALTAAIAAAHRDGWQIATHAIGDAGNAAVLDALTTLSPRALRPRIEHAQVVDVADIARFAELGVIASMQPTHATSDMPWAEARVGAARLPGAYAWRRMMDAKIALAFGSDVPVEDVRPVLGLFAAVTRQDVSGSPSGGWLPDQRLTLNEAIAAFTRGAAFASFHETERGQLAPGFAADVTVFDRALGDAIAPTTGIRATIVDGDVVFAASRRN